jgi:hypothetical protein
MRRPRLAAKLVAAVRLEMSERGFALVRTPPFFDDILFLRLGRARTVLQPDSDRWWKLPGLARYVCWLESFLARALPDEFLLLAALEFRHEQAGSVDAVTDRLHADGSYLRSVYTPFGPSTVYRDADAQRPVPPGRTLLMTAVGRSAALGVPCTLHRRPGAGPERAVLVCSFEPRCEDPGSPDVYCQVVATDRPRRRP